MAQESTPVNDNRAENDEVKPGDSAAPMPPPPNPEPASDRPLNVTDALSYLDSVKQQFHDEPKVYNQFLDIMKDFKSQFIDTPGVIERVSNLFHGHPALIQGFNTFLPPGYRIDINQDALNPNFITVTTPSGTTTQSTSGPFQLGGRSPHPESLARRVQEGELEPALAYLSKVKSRYATEPERYQQFLDLLQPERRNTLGDDAFVHMMTDVFKDDADLMQQFSEFFDSPIQSRAAVKLEEAAARQRAREAEARTSRRNTKAESSAAGPSSGTVPQKRKRKAIEQKEKEPLKAGPGKQPKRTKQQHNAGSEAPSPALSQRNAVPPSPRRSHLPPQPPNQAPIVIQHHPSTSSNVNDESHFFDRVKRALDNRETYNEFLKLVNLFTQDIIDVYRLVHDARNFLGDSELMAQFKDILGFDERREAFAYATDVWSRPMGYSEKPNRNNLVEQYGSYRKLPSHEANVICSGRDEMCKSVLNDEWVSMPTFASEDAGFIAHKKNIYEEALHRSEEERHEYDFHIHAIHRTIELLEPINNKFSQFTPEERTTYRKPNLLAGARSIHLRVIKKVFGREPGMEVWQAMQDMPAIAIPIVLNRLKQKHEEWKRAQREWNKVWREVDARNYYKSLDHQGITFKQADKKALSTKALVNHIEAVRDEQMAKRAALIDPLFARTRPRHQLEYVLDDPAVLQDAVKLTCSFLDRTLGQISSTDRKRIESFLRSFIPVFFMVDPIQFNANFVPKHESLGNSDRDPSETGSQMAADDAPEQSGASSSSSSKNGRANGKKGAAAFTNGGGDLRKKLLKAEQAKSSRRTRAQSANSASSSRPPSPPPAGGESMDVDEEEQVGANDSAPESPVEQRPTRKGTFYTNTMFYVLIRIIETLYSRLHLFKSLTAQAASEQQQNEPSVSINPTVDGVAALAEFAKLSVRGADSAQFYELFLESCEKLFDNEIEQNAFEDQLRYMFGIKHGYKGFTIDKVIGALVKQIQAILADQKSQELFDALRREREIPQPTSQDLINARKNAEKVLGPDENLFRLDWLPEDKLVTIQLLGKDDSSFDDSEVVTRRWQAYIDSYVSPDDTQGLPPMSLSRRKPFLNRNKALAYPSGSRSPESDQAPLAIAHSSLGIRVCVRTYRLFYVAGTEEYLFRKIYPDEVKMARKVAKLKDERRKAWVEKYLKGDEEDDEVEKEKEKDSNSEKDGDGPKRTEDGPKGQVKEAEAQDIAQKEESHVQTEAQPGMEKTQEASPAKEVDMIPTDTDAPVPASLPPAPLSAPLPALVPPGPVPVAVSVTVPVAAAPEVPITERDTSVVDMSTSPTPAPASASDPTPTPIPAEEPQPPA
ncbi:hypothetical protein K474DRAFT_1773588 [Panus rudis PR-1116 ss-1]|nr:hypothetical protein K474DRAFT_1773588 [Panus rudis PR-1116 ss-1]